MRPRIYRPVIVGASRHPNAPKKPKLLNATEEAQSPANSLWADFQQFFAANVQHVNPLVQ